MTQTARPTGVLTAPLPGWPAPARQRPAPARAATTRPSGGSTLLSFFGVGIEVRGVLPDLGFQFGPHVVHRGRTDLVVEISAPQAGRDAAPAGPRQVCVRRSDGLPLLRRPLRGWNTLPPPVPPFAALSDRFTLVPGIVMTKSRATVCLVGSALSPKAQIALALAGRAWRFVATQLLVLDRRTGEVLPCLAPLDLRGPDVVAAIRGGLAGSSWRSVRSALGGEVLLVRPESVGAVEPIDRRLGRPHLIGLCRGSGPDTRIVARDVPVRAWPARHPAPTLPGVVLEFPVGAVADEAAERLDDWFAGAPTGGR